MSYIIRCRRPFFRFEPYVPIIRQAVNQNIIVDPSGVDVEYWNTFQSPLSRRLIGEILPDDTILEAPSLVTPLLLKKNTIWPPRIRLDLELNENLESEPSDVSENDEVQILKVVNKEKSVATTRYRPADEYVKASIVANLSRTIGDKTILAIDDYYSSSVGNFLFSLGLSRVSEFSFENDVRKLASKIRKGRTNYIPDWESSKARLVEAEKSNRYYNLEAAHKCHRCSFKSEFLGVLESHLEQPHMDKKSYYSCNWCAFRTKDVSQINSHFILRHKKRCRIEKPPPLHCCRYCDFETKSKRKFTSHISKCEKSFQKDNVQGPSNFGETDFPGITSLSISQSDVKVYESTLKALRLAAYNPHQIKVSGTSINGQPSPPILIFAKRFVQDLKANDSNSALPVSLATSPYNNCPASFMARGSIHNIKNINHNNQTSPNLLQILAVQSTSTSSPQNRATIMKYPKPQSPFVNAMSVINSAQKVIMVPTASKSTRADANIVLSNNDQSAIKGQPYSDSTFLVCEICDCYIEDLVKFKSHMQGLHKVILHPKGTRPPLSCQKCQWRFYTDQGLERHLLSSHGLVTPNLRDQVESETDSGRCSICGCKFAKKLVAHMKEAHKLQLRPAHLSYRCTVCSATFCLYRLFEKHVYELHCKTPVTI